MPSYILLKTRQSQMLNGRIVSILLIGPGLFDLDCIIWFCGNKSQRRHRFHKTHFTVIKSIDIRVRKMLSRKFRRFTVEPVYAHIRNSDHAGYMILRNKNGRNGYRIRATEYNARLFFFCDEIKIEIKMRKPIYRFGFVTNRIPVHFQMIKSRCGCSCRKRNRSIMFQWLSRWAIRLMRQH